MKRRYFIGLLACVPFVGAFTQKRRKQMATYLIEDANETTIGGELVKAAEQGFFTGTITSILLDTPGEIHPFRLEINAELSDGEE